MSHLTRQCLAFQRISLRRDVASLKYPRLRFLRTYATHKDHLPSSLLSQQFEQHRKTPHDDSVGPFRLGTLQPSSKNEKKWSELSTGGKVLRTTARTTNFTVILLGAGLSAVLVYALASELFAKNSPTVLYGNACQRIKESPLVNKHLRSPLTFHNNPPSSLRPRHRNRHVNSLLAVDSSGREHLLLNFYVEGSDPSIPVLSDHDSQSRISQAYEWISSGIRTISSLTLNEAIAWTSSASSNALQASRRAFAYLIGQPLPPLPHLSLPPKEDIERNRKKSEESMWSLSGIFTRLTGKRRPKMGRGSEFSNGRQWTTGEVHADFVKDDNGVFVYRYLLVDIPDSNAANPLRLFVERTDGVRDGEMMVRWS